MTKTQADNYARRMTGGEALAEMLRAYGADTMFGMGGFQLLPFYEAVRALGLGHRLINDERRAPSRPTPIPASPASPACATGRSGRA